ncbi:HAMP domain-containing histidine kinase [Rhizobium sp. DKSPLA3]|uniref:histidine kinase n=1 Tax=Rhizobium quercicola TaxID=2901226 RepID=A0A9X1NY80_9HYPH|nr:HAMP domain-containing sensor histidine kinase [Rhizobium quercicola]MCD7111501.1 HAMP domain-containing histidine kinase [Rhizobium quercicola]
MRRARLWRSTPFRLAMTFGLVFVIAFVVTGLVTYRFLKQELLGELDASIMEIHALLSSTYAPDDLEDLISTVNTYARLTEADQRIFSVIDADGRQIAGNFSGKRVPDGISDVPSQLIGLEGDVDYRVMSATIGDKRLVVGQSYRQTDRLENITFISFIWATALVIGLAVIGGVLLGSRVQRRLDGIANAMTSVSHGQLDSRVPLHGNGDDIDTVSGQINQALDRLSMLMETMRQVSSDIAHELKTPLNRLKIQIDTAALAAELGKLDATALVGARDDIDQINATFEALLRISQIESGSRRTRFRQIDLIILLASVVEIYAEVAQDSRMRLTSSLDQHDPCRVLGDQELLTQMVVNLIENAIRHCGEGTHIDVSLRRVGDHGVITVADDGPGIPAEERDKVFLRLYRLDKSRTTTGSGLGLSLVRAIADLHGGRVELAGNSPGLRVEVLMPSVS